jgi:hypothetical protein
VEALQWYDNMAHFEKNWVWRSDELFIFIQFIAVSFSLVWYNFMTIA